MSSSSSSKTVKQTDYQPKHESTLTLQARHAALTTMYQEMWTKYHQLYDFTASLHAFVKAAFLIPGATGPEPSDESEDTIAALSHDELVERCALLEEHIDDLESDYEILEKDHIDLCDSLKTDWDGHTRLKA